MEPEKAIADIAANLSSIQSSLIEEAQKHVDAYWDWFTSENSRIAGLHKTGQATKEAGPHVNHIAPVIEYRGNAGYSLRKPYIIWKSFEPKLRRNLVAASPQKKSLRGSSIAIHAFSAIDATAPLRSRCTWNATRAIELEEKLIRIREAINGIHDLIKKNNTTSRRLARLTKTQGEQK